MIRLGVLIAALAIPLMSCAQGAKVFAPGSLRAPLEEASTAFSAYRAGAVTFEFGSPAILRDRLLKGEAADLFVSDDREQLEALTRSGRAGAARTLGPRHGFVILNGASPTGHAFANFLLGPESPASLR